MRYWTECREFFRQFRQQYDTTGSVLPSSRALARALTRPMRREKGPDTFSRRILEVGPGTGAVTREIVRALRPEDRFDIVEINTSFVDLIERRFDGEPDFRRRRHQTRIIHSAIQAVAGDAVYDFMISGIPLNNFGVPLVEEIFASYQRLLKPEGTLSYFEYVAIRDLKRTVVAPAERDRLAALSVLLGEKVRRYQVAEEVVVFNVPPAVARHFCFGKTLPG
jgi:phospholipid N-methyltransferase